MTAFITRLPLRPAIAANALHCNANCRYRAKLEACLPEVFVSFQAAHKGADGRMVQEALRRAVLRLLRVWRDRFIFNDDYINGLQVCVCVCLEGGRGLQLSPYLGAVVYP